MLGLSMKEKLYKAMMRQCEDKLPGFESDMRAQYLMEGIEGRIETMTDAVHQFVGDTEQSDDLTMLAIKFKQHQAI